MYAVPEGLTIVPRTAVLDLCADHGFRGLLDDGCQPAAGGKDGLALLL